jgi:hypothetical protein
MHTSLPWTQLSAYLNHARPFPSTFHPRQPFVTACVRIVRSHAATAAAETIGARSPRLDARRRSILVAILVAVCVATVVAIVLAERRTHATTIVLVVIVGCSSKRSIFWNRFL